MFHVIFLQNEGYVQIKDLAQIDLLKKLLECQEAKAFDNVFGSVCSKF